MALQLQHAYSGFVASSDSPLRNMKRRRQWNKGDIFSWLVGFHNPGRFMYHMSHVLHCAVIFPAAIHRRQVDGDDADMDPLSASRSEIELSQMANAQSTSPTNELPDNHPLKKVRPLLF